MNVRCITPARLAAFLVMFTALFLSSATSQAQVVDCTICDYFTIDVRVDLGCAVTICYLPTPTAQQVCTTVTAGGSIRIPCSSYRVWVKTCSGDYSIIPASSTAPCSPDLKFSAGCCGKICLVPNPVSPCPRLEISPVPCSSPSCP